LDFTCDIDVLAVANIARCILRKSSSLLRSNWKRRNPDSIEVSRSSAVVSNKYWISSSKKTSLSLN